MLEKRANRKLTHYPLLRRSRLPDQTSKFTRPHSWIRVAALNAVIFGNLTGRLEVAN